MIDYSLLDKSITYYEEHGFKRIESPWTVTEEILNLTKPVGAKDAFRLIHENKKGLVASGEQSFLYLYLKGFLPKGQFQTCTPCFRFENFDFLHSKYFIKNELIKTDIVNTATLEEVISCALSFFERIGLRNLEVIKTNPEANEKSKIIQSFDILSDKIELGSYGIRECSFLNWIYGTGLATPRTNMVLNKLI